MRKLLLVVVVLGAAAWWYFGWYSQRPSDLPPVRVDESQLTEAGRKRLADVRQRIEALEKAGTESRFNEALYISDGLRKLGDYRSAAEWYLKMIEWYEQLSPEERQHSERRPSIYMGMKPAEAPAIGSWHAGTCYFFAGENDKAFKVMERFLQDYPRAPLRSVVLDSYNLAKKDLNGYLEASSHLKATREYVK